MSDDVPPEEQPGTSTVVLTRSSASVPSTEIPKKGILKRPSWNAPTDGKPSMIPVPGIRASPDRLPDKETSKIPKLSVTWWEKNAVAIFGDTSDENNTDSEQILKDLGSGPKRATIRQTAILDSEEDSEEIFTAGHVADETVEEEEEQRDDAMSIASSTGSAASSIVGRWWTGKDMRFVPHCEKRGCNHNHHHGNGEIGEYLTPTQRRNKEMSQLKKELRSALNERDEKDRHLSELRDRIKEIEMMNDVQIALADSHKMMQRERETREQYEKEKKQTEKKHNVRVNQLVQETMQARDEIAKLTARIRELEGILGRPRSEVSTMTDAVQYACLSTSVPAPLSPTDPTDPSIVPQVAKTPPLSPLSPACSLPDRSSAIAAFAIPSPLSISVESKISGQPMYLSQEALNHIQAYQNEAFVWRTKAAQLEMVVKDQLLKSSQSEHQLRREFECVMAELDAYRKGLQPPPVPVISEQTSTENGSVAPQVSVSVLAMDRPPGGECTDPSCIERKKSLIEENKQLLLNIEDANTRIQELEEDVGALRTELEAMDSDRKHIKSRLDQAAKDLAEKNAEITAGGIAVSRLQTEKETLQKAIDYMEERMQVYQNTLMEHDLVVSDETSGNWRKGFNDPRYSVMVSKRIQTELTSQALFEHEDEFKSTKRRLEELHSEFAANRSDLKGRFEEIEEILLAKTQLVEALTKQMEDIRRDQRAQLDEHQNEREEYKKSLSSMAAVAEKVPLLETRIQELLKEISELERRLKTQREEYEEGLEEALSETLNKYKEQSDYWKDKVAVLETQLERAKNEVTQLAKEKEDLRLKARLEKVDLEQRLTSSIDHVTQLNSQINKPRRDVECEARPRHVSKYVACRPNAKSKSTTIEKGDLFDESEERLKLCQGELATTRRQVHVLQQKLISTMQEKVDKRVPIRKKIACVMEKPGTSEESKDNREEKIETLESKNAELREKLSRVEDEKAELMEQEKDRIQHLAQEFDNVRQELDQEMCRYDSEKKWLKSRIANLEKDNRELQRQLDEKSITPPNKSRQLPTISVHDEDKISMRKTLSEPELGFEDEEISQLRAENSRLQRELDRVRESLKRTASAASAASRRSNRSQLSPAFGHLADDLNMVKSDLEQILSQMDEEAPAHPSPSPTARRTPAEEEQLQSQILDKVMLDWEADEREALARDLKRSREERNNLKGRIDKLSAELNRATAELEVFRQERREDGGTGDGRLTRSRSVVDLQDHGDPEEAERWKNKCGTMFRELNAMRSGYTKAMEERRELKIKVAMLLGELEISRCQPNNGRRGSMTSSAYFSPKSVRSTSVGGYHTADDGRNHAQGDVIVHESPVAFRRGSTKEAVACTVTASTSLRNLVEVEGRMDTRTTRAHSVKTRIRKRASSKEDYAAMEHRRSQRQKSSSVYATAPHSVSSSMTSLNNFATPDHLVAKPPPCMSQSWHEPSTSSKPDDSEKQKQSEESSRSQNRVTSLREKVGRLTRDNTVLATELEKQRKKALALEQKLGYLSGVDAQRLTNLEKEKESLREQVGLLLQKIEQERKANVLDNRLEEQLTLSRQEVEMYERKLKEMEEERREMYLVMFKKGQQAATMDLSQKKELDQMTQDRIVLKFLHDAFYYFLLNKGDSKEHLQAIMTMLDFSSEQKEDVLRRRGKSH